MEPTAVILAAGVGSRMKSNLPKVMHQVAGKPMLLWVMDALRQAKVEKQLVILGHKGEQVAALVENQGQVVYQREQLGTGHAVMQAMSLLALEEGPVLVVCGDTPLLRAETLSDLLVMHQAQGHVVTVLSGVVADPFGYGRIVLADGQVQAIVEEKDASPDQKLIKEVNGGTYCFDRQFLLSGLKKLTKNNAQGEYYLTDLIKMAADGRLGVGHYCLRDSEEMLGVNNRVQLSQAEKIIYQRKCHQLMMDGVTIIDPDQTYIQTQVVVGMDTVIYPGVILEGECVIGHECIIGSNSRLRDAQIGDGTKIEQSVIVESMVGEQCQIGPFAYLRPGTELADQVKIGDFVEIKKSHIGQGSKVPHLSYIGDATIGSGVNIGCGTITCNYDGKNKHQTIIEDGAFIGSNSNLIAPIVIERNATVGAGSTISKNIPAGSLALTRGELKVKENWQKNK